MYTMYQPQHPISLSVVILLVACMAGAAMSQDGVSPQGDHLGGSVPRLPDTEVTAPAPTDAAPPVDDVAEPPVEDEKAGTFYQSPFASAPVSGYGAGSSATAMLVDTPLLSVPQAVSIVPGDLIRDQQLFSVSEAFRNVSGVISDVTQGNVAASAAEFNYIIRGFPTTYRRWNGYRSDLIQTSIDTGNIDRIEFIKGPSSVLYGASDVGGFLNIVTKKPVRQNFATAIFSSGSWGLARTQIDVNEVISEDILFRMNVALQSADSFRDFANDDRILIAPVLTMVLTEDTLLTFEGEYYSTNTKMDLGVAALNNNIYALPRSRWLMAPGDTAFGDYFKSSIVLDHSFNEDWSARLAYFYSSTQQAVRTHTPAGIATPTSIFQAPAQQLDYGTLPTLNGYIAGTMQVAGMTHHVTAGMEYEWIATQTETDFSFANAILLDAYNPQYSNTFPPFNPTYRDQGIQVQIGTLQDRIELNEYFEVVGGVSYQNFDRNARLAPPLFPATTTKDNVNDWTPRASAIWHPIPEEVSVWYSYSESINVQSIPLFNPNGGLIPATAGSQNEVGVRYAPTNRFIASAAIYQLFKTAVPIFVPGFLSGFAVPVNARSQGVEADIYGQITERLSIVANYAYIDVRAINNTAGLNLTNGQLPLVPRNNANFWGKYNLIDNQTDRGQPQTFGAGLGLRWLDARTTLTFPAFPGVVQTMPSYVTVDAGLFYRRGPSFLSLYLENLGDAAYFTSGLGSFLVPGAPFNVRASAGLTF